MSKQNSQQTIVERSQSIYDQIDFPIIDKEKYPHGGYIKLRDLGWRDYRKYQFHVEDNPVCTFFRVAHFEDLNSISMKHWSSHIDPILWSDDTTNALPLGMDEKGPYLIAGYRNGELRVSLTDTDNAAPCYLYYSEDLFSVECYDLEFYLSLEKYREDQIQEFTKPYVQQQAALFSNKGYLSTDNFLEIKIFHENAEKYFSSRLTRNLAKFLIDNKDWCEQNGVCSDGEISMEWETLLKTVRSKYLRWEFFHDNEHLLPTLAPGEQYRELREFFNTFRSYCPDLQEGWYKEKNDVNGFRLKPEWSIATGDKKTDCWNKYILNKESKLTPYFFEIAQPFPDWETALVVQYLNGEINIGCWLEDPDENFYLGKNLIKKYGQDPYLFDSYDHPCLYVDEDAFILGPIENEYEWDRDPYDFFSWALTCPSTQRQFQELKRILEDDFCIDDLLSIKLSISEYELWKKYFFARNKVDQAYKVVDSLLDSLQKTNSYSSSVCIVLASLYLEHTKNGYRDENIMSFIRTLSPINLSKSLSEDQIILLMANYQTVVEYCCNFNSNRMSRYDNTLFSQPHELTKFCKELLSPKQNSSIYIPFASVGDYALEFDDKYVTCDEKQDTAIFISRLRLHASNSISNPIQRDSLEYLRTTRDHYDAILMTPPFGVMENNSHKTVDCKALTLAVKHADKVICVLPMSFTFSEGYAKLRQHLLKSHRLSAVIALPQLFLPYTSISTCVVVIDDKADDQGVALIDGSSFFEKSKYSQKGKFLYKSLLEAIDINSSDYCCLLSEEELFDNQNILTPARYLLRLPKLNEGESYVSLSELVELVPTTSMKTQMLVSQADFPDNYLSDTVKPHLKPGAKATANVVESQVLLVNTTGKLKVGKTDDGTTHLSKDIIPFRVKNDAINEEYLLIQMMSEYVQKQFDSLSSGIGTQRLSDSDFLGIKILVVTDDEQFMQVKRFYDSRLSKSEQELHRQFDLYQKDIHIRKHALTQNTSAISSRWNSLMKYFQDNNGVLTANDMIGLRNPQTVSAILQSISNVINVLSIQVDHIAEIEYNWGESEEISLNTFLEEYRRNMISNRFEILPISCSKDENVMILIPPRALRQVLDNIVSNAQTHGFTDSNRDDYKILISCFNDENQTPIVTITNNGEPLAKDLDSEMVFSYGYSSVLNQEYSIGEVTATHFGIGGSESKSILEKFGGQISISSLDPERDSGYTVVYRITMKKAQ